MIKLSSGKDTGWKPVPLRKWSYGGPGPPYLGIYGRGGGKGKVAKLELGGKRAFPSGSLGTRVGDCMLKAGGAALSRHKEMGSEESFGYEDPV
jgi:hypothetical protein